MIITRTPFRVSLFGGGSDYPAWFTRHSGAVLGFAINKYCYISLRKLPPFFEHKHRIVYSRVENVKEISQIQHPAVRAVLGDQKVTQGLEIHHDGDLPARSGLGSSSSFTVGLLNALNAMEGKLASPKSLANEAIRIEQKVIGEAVGSQDQIWAAYGGLNRIRFFSDGSFDVEPLVLPQERKTLLEDHCMLFFSGISRYAAQVAERKIASLAQRSNNVRAMTAMVDEAASMLGNPTVPLSDIGMLLHDSWMLKRELTDGVTTPEIDEIYTAAREEGAIGGKLLGAGGGGFVLVFAEPDKHDAIRARLNHLVEVDIKICSSGSRVVVYEPDLS